MAETTTLLEEISSYDALKKAWTSLNKSNKLSHGLSGETIKEFADNLDSNLQSIHDRLSKGTYQFSPVRGIAIDKGKADADGNPEYRPIKVQEVRDRVVLKAVANAVGKSLSDKFGLNNAASFAYRRNHGVGDAIARMVELYKEGRTVVLEADIQKFFDSVEMSRLLEDKVLPALKDRTLDDLLREGLSQEVGKAEHLDEFQLMAFEKTKGGIPQGSALSPLLSNIALAEFDQRMLAEGYGLIRYADDFIVMCRTEDEAKEAYKIAEEEIEAKLKLKLYGFDSPVKPARIAYPDRENFSFLSIRFRGHELFPEPDKVKELREKVRAVCTMTVWSHEEKKKVDNDIMTILRRVNNLTCGWLAAFAYSDIDRYFVEIDEYINKELANILRRMGWNLKSTARTVKSYSGGKRECLSPEQRRYSGVHTCRSFFEQVMTHREKIEL